MLGWVVKRVREPVDSVRVQLLGDRGAPYGLPPRRLRARTGAPGAGEFVIGGFEAAHQLADALGATDCSRERIGAVLDFGCGSGRVLPHVAALAPQARCHGCDVDPNAIRWAARHRPELHWAISGTLPPLPFASESFDLVYSISVFSHLDQELQDRWLNELRRILAPGGIALLSVHGAHALDQFRSGRVRTGWCPSDSFRRGPLGRGEFAFVPYVRSFWTRSELPRVGPRYGLAFHGSDYIRERWARSLEVVEVRPRAIAGWQDIVVCRRPSS